MGAGPKDSSPIQLSIGNERKRLVRVWDLVYSLATKDDILKISRNFSELNTKFERSRDSYISNLCPLIF